MRHEGLPKRVIKWENPKTSHFYGPALGQPSPPNLSHRLALGQPGPLKFLTLIDKPWPSPAFQIPHFYRWALGRLAQPNLSLLSTGPGPNPSLLSTGPGQPNPSLLLARFLASISPPAGVTPRPRGMPLERPLPVCPGLGPPYLTNPHMLQYS